jgi:hypothetical protein
MLTAWVSSAAAAIFYGARRFALLEAKVVELEKQRHSDREHIDERLAEIRALCAEVKERIDTQDASMRELLLRLLERQE